MTLPFPTGLPPVRITAPPPSPLEQALALLKLSERKPKDLMASDMPQSPEEPEDRPPFDLQEFLNQRVPVSPGTLPPAIIVAPKPNPIEQALAQAQLRTTADQIPEAPSAERRLAAAILGGTGILGMAEESEKARSGPSLPTMLEAYKRGQPEEIAALEAKEREAQQAGLGLALSLGVPGGSELSAAEQEAEQVAKGLSALGSRIVKPPTAFERLMATPDKLTRAIEQGAESTYGIRKFGEAAEKARVVRPAESPATAVNQYLNTASEQEQALRGVGLRNPRFDPESPYQSGDILTKPLSWVFEPLETKEKRDFFEKFLVAKRSLNRGEDVAYNLADQNLQEVRQWQAVVRAGEVDPAIAEATKRYIEYSNGVRQYLVNANLLTPETVTKLANADQFYLPFIQEYERNIPPKVMGGSGKIGNVTIKPLEMTATKGLRIRPPFLSMAETTNLAIKRGNQQRVTDSIIRTIEAMGPDGAKFATPVDAPVNVANKKKVLDLLEGENIDPDVAQQVADDLAVATPVDKYRSGDVISTLRDGKRVYYKLHDPSLAASMAALDPESYGVVGQRLASVMVPIKRVVTATATALKAPFALGTNPLRDLPRAVFNQPGTANQLLPAVKDAVTSAFGQQSLIDQMRYYGVDNPSIFFESRTLTPQQFQAQYVRGGVLQKVKRIAEAPLRLAENIGAKVERYPRFASALAAREAGLAEWGNLDDANALAARAFNRGTVDFRPSPASPVMKFFNDITPFLGAGTKGMVRFGEFAAQAPERAATEASLVAAATTATYMYSKKTDRQQYVDRIPDERARALYFGGHRYPLGQEQAVVSAATNWALAKMEKDDPEAFAVLSAAFANALPPFPVPDYITSLISGKTYQGVPVVPKALEKLPVTEQRAATTPTTFTAISRGMERLAGPGSSLVPSPRRLEYTTQQLLGPLSRGATAITDPLAAKLMGAATPVVQPSQPEDISEFNPLRAITAPPMRTTASEQWFYNTLDQLTKKRAAALDAIKSADPNDIESVKLALQQRNIDPTPKVMGDLATQFYMQKASEHLSQVNTVLRILQSGQPVDVTKAISALQQLGVYPSDAATKNVELSDVIKSAVSNKQQLLRYIRTNLSPRIVQ
jgi:hypothetical protein